jgi:hypothetical protein
LIFQSKPAATKLEVLLLLTDTKAWTWGLPSQRQALEPVGAIAQVDVGAVLAAGGAQADGVAQERDVVLVGADEHFAGEAGAAKATAAQAAAANRAFFMWLSPAKSSVLLWLERRSSQRVSITRGRARGLRMSIALSDIQAAAGRLAGQAVAPR